MGFLLDPLGFLAQLPHPYLLLFFGANWPLNQPMSLLIYFLGFPGPFTSHLPLIIPMGLLFHSMGFLSPFTPSLPFFILVGLLAINPAISACWACFLIPLLFSLSHLFYIVRLLLLLGHLSKVAINSPLVFRYYI